MSTERLVAEYIAHTRWQDLPAEVQRKARMAMLDNLAAAIAGTRTKGYEIASTYAARTWQGQAATLIGRAARATAPGAAFANGQAANAIDIDDNGQYTKGHTGAQIFAAALAAAESTNADGAALLASTVVGYEVAHRAGRCWHDHHNTIYQGCGAWGSLACAAIAANLMQLPPEQCNEALGIAEYHSPNAPIMRDVADPGMVKHAIGWGAMNGIVSAELAAAGFTGIPSILGFQEYADWVSDIGQHYIMVDGVVWKGYACCTWAHPGLKASVLLQQRYQFSPDDIEHILVECPCEGMVLGTERPTTTEQAQFNLAWPLAALLLDGVVGPEQILEERLNDPAVLALASKIEAVESPELTERFSEIANDDSNGGYGGAVTITLRDGRKLASGVVQEDMTYPQPDWDNARLEKKFRWLSEPVFGQERTERLIELVWQLDTLPDLATLSSLLGA